jgi:hypothetical protein
MARGRSQGRCSAARACSATAWFTSTRSRCRRSTTCGSTWVHLRARGVEQIGVAGISLGGAAAALLAAVDERLAFCIPVVPGVSPIDAFLEWQPTGALLAGLMRSQGVGVAEMRGLLAINNGAQLCATHCRRSCPHHRRRRRPGQRARAMSRLLHQHLPGSSLHWFPGNHGLHFGRAEYLARMQALMDRCTAQ